MSSFKCLSIVKKRLDLQKVGHLGTLDPLACGVLVLLCGKACKKAQDLSSGHKVYRSVFTFGIETTTLDSEGEITSECAIIPTKEEVKRVLPELVGEIEIEVPKFSAVHIGGRRAYDLARKGVEFTAPRRSVCIYRFELLDGKDGLITEEFPAKNKFLFEIECHTGTYIRSLAKLLAGKLNTVAIASTIIRTKSGEFDIKDSKNIQEVTLGDIRL
jgi:tRNA pseudouridine55 synthase